MSFLQDIRSGVQNLFGSSGGQMMSPIPTQNNTPQGNTSGRLYQGPVQQGRTRETFALTGRDPMRQGSVLGASTTAPSGVSGGGGGGSASSSLSASFSGGSSQMGEAPLEQVPSGPDMSYLDAIINPALEGLAAFESTLQPQFESNVQQVERGSQGIIGGLNTELENRLAGFNQNRQTEEGRFEGDVARSRREAAQLLQGIQSRFGGSTGTGQFTSEIVGGEALRNIAGLRQGFQETMGKISTAENSLKSEIANRIEQENIRVENQKQQLRDQLRAQLADIQQQRGQLQSRKAELAQNAMQNFQNLVADINARNTSFKQAMFQQQQAAQQQLAEIQARAQQKYTSAAQSLSPGQLASLINAGLTPTDQALSLTGLEGAFTLPQQQQQDEFGVPQSLSGQSSFAAQLAASLPQ